jgi:hypothetical protein
VRRLLIGLLFLASPVLAQEQGQQSAGIVFYSSSGSGSGTVGPGTANCIPNFATTTTLGTSDLCNTSGSGSFTIQNMPAATLGKVFVIGPTADTSHVGLGWTSSPLGLDVVLGDFSNFARLNVLSLSLTPNGVVTGSGSGAFVSTMGAIQFAASPAKVSSTVGDSSVLSIHEALRYQINGASLGLSQFAAGVVQADAGDGSTAADFTAQKSALIAGTMTVTSSAFIRDSISRFDFTNAMVVALGSNLTGTIKVATLPAKTVVRNAYMVEQTQCAGTTTLTVSVGRTSATYIDYLVAKTFQAAAGTTYGGVSGDRGTNLTGYDLPSYSATTDVFALFTSTVANLSSVTGCTGTVYLDTYILP